MQKHRLLEQALPSLFPFSPPPSPFAPATQATVPINLGRETGPLSTGVTNADPQSMITSSLHLKGKRERESKEPKCPRYRSVRIIIV